MGLALFLGAGFSKWSVDLPVASQLFDFEIEPFGAREYRKLEIIKSFKKNWDTLHPNGLAEQFIAHTLNYSMEKRETLSWYITRRLSEPFIWKEFQAQRWRRHVLMIDENRKLRIEGIIKAQKFLQRFCNPKLMGIITTNYDMVIEYALGTKGFNYGVHNQILTGRGPYPVSQWKNPVILKGKVTLSKIHGSVNWDKNSCYTDGRRGLTGNALIVAPTQEKRKPKELETIWGLAENILGSSKKLLIFGFSFNPYDEAVLNLLKTSGKNIISILLIDIEPKIEQARKLYPNAKITHCAPPPEGNNEIQSWLRS